MSKQQQASGVSTRVVSIAIAGTVILGLGAAVLSFTALTDLAVRAGVPSGLGFVWPIIVDGLIVVSTIAVFAAAGPSQRGVRRYAWALLALGAGVSVVANGAHALVAAHASTPRVMAVAVASVPPIVLLAVTHLTALLARRTPEPAEPVELVVETGLDPEPEKAPAPALEVSQTDWLSGPLPSKAQALAPAAAPSVSLDAAAPAVGGWIGAEATASHIDTTQTMNAEPDAPVAPAPVAPIAAVSSESESAASAEDFRAWVAQRVRAGHVVSGKEAHEAGLVGSVRTGTRRIAALRKDDPNLFDPRVLRAVGQVGA